MYTRPYPQSGSIQYALERILFVEFEFGIHRHVYLIQEQSLIISIIVNGVRLRLVSMDIHQLIIGYGPGGMIVMAHAPLLVDCTVLQFSTMAGVANEDRCVIIKFDPFMTSENLV